MPRLPQRVSQEKPNFFYSQQSIGAAQAPGTAIERVGNQVEAIGLELAQQEVELRRKRIVMEKTAEAADQADKLYNDIINDPDVDNENLTDTVQKGFKLLQERIGKDIKDRTAKIVFDGNFTSLTVERGIKARMLQREREIDASRSALATSLDKMTHLAVNASGQELDAILGQIEGNLAGAVAAREMTQLAATNTSLAIREEIDTGKIINRIRDDPHGALKDLESGLYDNIGVERRQRFMDEAQNAAEAKDAEVLRLRIYNETQAEKKFKQLSDDELTNFTSRAWNGDVGIQEAQEAAKRFKWSQSEQNVLMNLIVDGPPLVMNPQAERNAMVKAFGSDPPRITQSEANELLNSGGLSGGMWEKITNHLRDDGSETKGYSDGVTRIKQALGITSDFDIIEDEEQRNIIALALEEFSDARKSGENLFDAVDRIKKRYLPLMPELMNTRISVMKKTVPASVANSGMEWKKTLGTFEEAKRKYGITSRDEYIRIYDTMKEIEELDSTFIQEFDKMKKALTGQ